MVFKWKNNPIQKDLLQQCERKMKKLKRQKIGMDGAHSVQ